MTNWTGRMPPSYSITLYNEGTWDDDTPWSGIIVNEQAWGLTRLGGEYLLDWQGNQILDWNSEPIMTIVPGGHFPITIFTPRTPV